MVVFSHATEELLVKLRSLGFRSVSVTSPYEQKRWKKGTVHAVLYTSGKLLLQGKEEEVHQVERHLRGQKPIEAQPFRAEKGWLIGSDESLKGDTFGGIVVAAVKADDALREKLRELGVADSKELEDEEILPMAEKIRAIAGCEVKILLPDEYNQHLKHGNVTALLNKLHQDCANFLKPGKQVVDKYPGCTVGDVQVEKGESKYVEIAAASVLARAAALKQFQYLSRLAGFEIPKGSTHVRGALEELKKRGLDFRKLVKMEFGNVGEFL